MGKQLFHCVRTASTHNTVKTRMVLRLCGMVTDVMYNVYVWRASNGIYFIHYVLKNRSAAHLSHFIIFRIVSIFHIRVVFVVVT